MSLDCVDIYIFACLHVPSLEIFLLWGVIGVAAIAEKVYSTYILSWHSSVHGSLYCILEMKVNSLHRHGKQGSKILIHPSALGYTFGDLILFWWCGERDHLPQDFRAGGIFCGSPEVVELQLLGQDRHCWRIMGVTVQQHVEGHMFLTSCFRISAAGLVPNGSHLIPMYISNLSTSNWEGLFFWQQEKTTVDCANLTFPVWVSLQQQTSMNCYRCGYVLFCHPWLNCCRYFTPL